MLFSRIGIIWAQMKFCNFLFKILMFFCISSFASEPKVYDCFLFFNEFEVLNIRLHELYDSVDYFVLVESEETFRGSPKPFHFENNKERFAPFLDKIIHIKVSDHFVTNDPWEREEFQRNQISRGLGNCGPHDIIFISDVDEIFRKQIVLAVKDYFSDPYYKGAILGCEMKMYAHYINQPFDFGWRATSAATGCYLPEYTPQMLRNFSHHPGHYPGACNYLMDAGWHFSWMGDVQSWITKWRAYSHGNDEIPSEKKILEAKKKRTLLPLGRFLSTTYQR